VNEIADRIRETPQDIRVRCPRGHLIADVRLEVPDGQDTIAMWPHGPQKHYAFSHLAGLYGFWMSLARSKMRRAPRWKCPNARCRYSANVNYESLALELAAAALAGQTEYRLTT
jgi:hypothetical protein